MDGYDAPVAALDCPTWLRQLRQGAYLTRTFSGDAMPAVWYGCPPGLIPLTSNGSALLYRGIWVCWFRPGHPRSYVMSDIEDACRLREIAITDAQFAAWMIIQAIVCNDDVTDEAIRFHADTRPLDLERLDEHTMAHGDGWEGLTALPLFQNPRPNAVGTRSEATGGVLHPQHTAPARFRDACWFELSEEQQRIALDHPDAAPWLRRDAPVARLFDDYLSSGRQAEAWATLNSTGWSLPDARAAAERLAAATDRPLLTLQLRAWIAFSQQTDIPERYGY